MSSRFSSNGLADLASNNQQTRDAALLRATTELFVQETAHDRDEIRRYEELVSHFLPKVAISDRIFQAERLATRIDAPQSIIGMLAKDVIDVAEPVIRRSPVLKPLDLLAVIAATGIEHHRLVARRPGIGEDVERALRLTGDARVLAHLRQTKALSQGNAAATAAAAISARSGKGRAPVDAIADGLGVEAPFVRAALDDPSGEPLAVLLKALSLDSTLAQQVFLLVGRTIGRDVNAFFRLADIYAGMESFVAETLVEGWRSRTRTEAPKHQPLFAEDGNFSRQPATAEISREHPATPARRSESG